MISVKLMACGTHVVRDADSNTVSIFNILEGIAGAGFPLLVQSFAALVILQRDPTADAAEHDGTFEISIGGQQLVRANVHVNFEDKKHTRQIVRLNGMVVPAPGTLEMRFQMGELSQAYTIAIEALTPAQIQAIQGGVS